MDYPYIEIQARNADGGQVTALLQFTSGDIPVTESDIVTAVRERMETALGVISVTATRHHIAQTPA